MPRLLGLLAVLLVTPPARAADPPEKYLPPGTQVYVRWDGVTPHQAAYDGSALGSVMKGPTGDAVRSLLAQGPKLLGNALLADPLLAGKPPEELKAVHADLRHLDKLIGLLADNGVIVAAEVKEPRPTLKGIGQALGGLLGGPNAGKAAEGFVPEVKAFLVVPDVGDRAETLFAPTRLYNRSAGQPVASPLPDKLGVKGYAWPSEANGPLHLGEWVIDGHFVEYAGTVPVEAVVAGMKADAAKGGLSASPLLARAKKIEGFESVARGFVDAGSVVGLTKRLAGPFVPGLGEKLDAFGVGKLQAVVFSSGFQGKESRARYEFDLPERVGLGRVLKPKPVTVADLPPLPPDVTRFSLLRVDYAAAYDAGLGLVDQLVSEKFGVEEPGQSAAEVSAARREFLDRELTKALGISVRDDLLAHLGDKVCLYQSPVEGVSVLGLVVCVSCKDPAKVRAAADRLARTAEGLAGGRVKARRRTVKGVDVREVYGRDFGPITPTYAVVGDWLVMAFHPQPVHGMALRHAGELARWQPDADTAARLKGMPADAVGLQYCNPRFTVYMLTSIGPSAIGLMGSLFSRRGNEEFDPLDIGALPNGYELARHLFPNLTYTRDDGKTIRIEVNESFSLPLEFVGLDPGIFFFGLAGLRF